MKRLWVVQSSDRELKEHHRKLVLVEINACVFLIAQNEIIQKTV